MTHVRLSLRACVLAPAVMAITCGSAIPAGAAPAACTITIAKTPEKWVPEGRAFKSKVGDPGNTVELTAQVTAHGPRKIRFFLEDVSDEPGVCLNFGAESNTDKDLRFVRDTKLNANFDTPGANGANITTKAKVATATVTVTSFDWGAYGKIKACCLKADDSDCETATAAQSLPVDADGNHIADAATQNKGPGATTGAADDNDDTPAGEGTRGDGISRYEEYRGFIVGGKHTRLDVTMKDVFVRNVDVTDAGAAGFLTTANLTAPVHVITRDEWQSASRVVNFKHGTSHGDDQQAIKVTNGGAAADGLWGEAEVRGATFVPNRQNHCKVFVDEIKSGVGLPRALAKKATEILLDSTDGFRDSGRLRIEFERVTYTGKTATTLTGVTRGVGTTNAARHGKNKIVSFFNDPVSFIKRVFAHEAGHLVGLIHDPEPAVACDGQGENIMSEFVCPGATLGAGYWDKFVGTNSSLGTLRVKE